jgi:LCP family protein required for cell wall assembly
VASTEAIAPGGDVRRRSQLAGLRRGLAMIGMTIVVPGSAQLAAGNRRIGRWGVRVWAALVLAGLLALVGVFLARNVLLGIFTTGWVLWLGSWVVLALGLFWAFLFVNALWASRPRDMGALRGGILGAVALVLAGVVATGAIITSSALRASGSAVSSIFGGGGSNQQKAGRYNVLLLGSDAGNDREGTRTDSITVASIDAQTGRTVLFGLPRNLEDMPFPDSSPLKKLYPNGYGCPNHTCLLNAIYLLGQEHKKLYPGVKDPGVQAVKEAVEAATGLPINYYAMVDMYGFADLIDALGGIRLDISKRVPKGGWGAPPSAGYIEPGPNRLLTGPEALWFARDRDGSSDYARMMRQKCVMVAMLHQMDPPTVAAKFSQIASATGRILVTDVPSTDVGMLVDLATKAKSLDIANVAFTPPLIAPGSPNYALVRSTVVDAIKASEDLDAAATKPAAPSSSKAAAPTTSAATSKAATAKTTAKTTAKATTAAPTDEPATTTEDLSAICTAR